MGSPFLIMSNDDKKYEGLNEEEAKMWKELSTPYKKKTFSELAREAWLKIATDAKSNKKGF